MKVRWLKCITAMLLFRKAIAAVCSTRSVIPFSGFKVHRKYAISFFPLHIDHFVELTKCKRGEEIFSISVPLNTSTVEFSTRFCTDFQNPLSLAASPGSLRWHLQRIRNSIPIPDRTRLMRRLRKTRAFSFLQALLADRRFGRIFHWYQDLALDPNTSRCFRMARRKRYANLNLVLFVPTTFVGGLFFNESESGGCKGSNSTSQGGGVGTCMGGNGRPEIVSDMEHATKTPEETYIDGALGPLAGATLNYLQPRSHAGEGHHVEPGRQTNEMEMKASVIERQATDVELQATDAELQVTDSEQTATGTELQIPDIKLQAPDIKLQAPKIEPQSTGAGDEKMQTQQDYTSTDAFSQDEAVPLCPLVADDYATHWLSLLLSLGKLIYHVPYLKSPSYWDPRFPKTTPDEYSDSWMREVDLGERYTYDQLEQAVLSAALADALDSLYTKFESFGPRFSRIMMYKLTMLAKLDSSLVLALFLSSADKAKSISVVKALQDVWENSAETDQMTRPQANEEIA